MFSSSISRTIRFITCISISVTICNICLSRSRLQGSSRAGVAPPQSRWGAAVSGLVPFLGSVPERSPSSAALLVLLPRQGLHSCRPPRDPGQAWYSRLPGGATPDERAAPPGGVSVSVLVLVLPWSFSDSDGSGRSSDTPLDGYTPCRLSKSPVHH